MSRPLAEVEAELALKAKRAPPPAPPVPGIAQLTPAAAAEKAAAIRSDRRFWDPSKANAEGKKLTATEHEQLVREHQELLARAETDDSTAR